MTWQATTDTALAAVADARIAAVLAVVEAVDAAILAGNVEGFAACFAPEAVVNHPGNGSFPGAFATRAFELGMIDYHSIAREVDFAAVRPTGEVLLMGSEMVTPRGKAQHAGKACRRRFTEVWREIDGAWRLSLRQATYFEIG
jgi:ketosteroid isomerase-like protein